MERNLTNQTNSGGQCDDPVGLYAYACFYYGVHDYLSVILCCFGIPANFVNIFILTRKTMRTPINIILTGIAVSDMLTMLSYLLWAIHFRVMYGLDDNRPGKNTYGWTLFLAFHICLTITTYTISIWLGVCMSIVRYIYISSLGTRQPGADERRSCILVTIVFTLSIIAYIPKYVTTKIENINSTEVYRYQGFEIQSPNLSPLQTAFVWIFLVIGKWIPCFLIIVFGILLVCTLHKSKKRTEKLKGAQTKARLKQHTRTTAMLLVIILMYIVSELPQTIVLVISYVSKNFLDYILLGDTIDIICLINNSVNIVLYCAMSKQFRDMLWSSLCNVFRLSDPKRYMTVQTTVTHTCPTKNVCYEP
ncbi:G-protein coupled receptor dmsr-1-like [Saccostrea cucullata]|uniref:G-protein coupled receptor dmsr-1-like n=1 Tax=Saccostrea cuccullata TaxID=36930 RepID=UPI002ED33DDF